MYLTRKFYWKKVQQKFLRKRRKLPRIEIDLCKERCLETESRLWYEHLFRQGWQAKAELSQLLGKANFCKVFVNLMFYIYCDFEMNDLQNVILR